MTPELWEKLKQVFSDALEHEPAEREAFVREAALDDPELLSELLRLLAESDRDSGLLSRPALTWASEHDEGPRFDPETVLAHRLRVVRFIARGGMGEVYEAEDLELGERVAVKAIRQHNAPDRELLALFKKEVQLARRVTHPNVCRIFDLVLHEVEGNTTPVMLLSMELLEGQTLSERLRQSGPLSFRDALPLIEDIAAGLQAVHDAGIIHGDLKPGNVMLATGHGDCDTGPRAVVMDFGMALPMSPDSPGQSLTRGGTPEYSAPEQVAGAPLTTATDVYCLALMISDMLGVPRPARLNPSAHRMPSPWARALRRCLQSEPARRYARPSELASALKGSADSRRRTIIRVAAAAVVAAVGIPAAVFLSSRTGTIQGPRAMTLRQVWSGPEADATGSPSPDGRFLSYVHWETGDLALHDLVTGQNRLLTNKGAWKQSAEFADLNLISPDGKLVAYSWDDGKTRAEGRAGELRTIPINGPSRVRVVYRDRDVQWLEPRCWSPDGKSILAWLYRKDETNQIAILSVADGSVRIIKTLHKGAQYRGRPLFSPDGRYIAYDYRGDIFVLAASGTGEEVSVAPHPAFDRLLAWAPDGKRILFASSRSGALGAWIIRVADGKPQGSPHLIKPEIGEISPIGFGTNGSFFYGLTRQVNDVYIAALDMASGKVISPPKTVSEHELGTSSSADWSPDGRELVYRSGRTVSVLSVESGRVTRELVPPVFGPLHWSPDGSSILGFGDVRRPGLYTFDSRTGVAALLAPVEPGSGIRDTAWAPDRKTVFYHAMNTVYSRNVSSGETKEICLSTGDSVIRSFAVSPDGRQVACVSASSLAVVTSSGGTPRELLRLQGVYDHFQFDGGVAWTPDGSQIVFARGDPAVGGFSLWRIPAAGGQPQKLELAPDRISEIRLHPDGRRVAYTVGSATNEVWVMENFLK